MKLLPFFILLFTIGSLGAETLIMGGYDRTTSEGSEEFSDSLKMTLQSEFQEKVKSEIEKETGHKLKHDLSRYIELSFIAYSNTVEVIGLDADLTEASGVFIAVFIDQRRQAANRATIREREEQRNAIKSSGIELKDLSDEQKALLEQDLEGLLNGSIKDGNYISIDGPRWRRS